MIRESAPVLATTRPAEPRAENLDPDDPPSPERTAETEAPRRTAVAVSSPPAPAETGPTASDGIAEALKHLQLAYERRDATLAKAVWPSVNERALARAFDDLRSQSVTFDRCRLNVSEGAGEVQCRGVTTYVPRVGDQYQRSESREWTFRMRKGGDGWLITSAAAR